MSRAARPGTANSSLSPCPAAWGPGMASPGRLEKRAGGPQPGMQKARAAAGASTTSGCTLQEPLQPAQTCTHMQMVHAYSQACGATPCSMVPCGVEHSIQVDPGVVSPKGQHGSKACSSQHAELVLQQRALHREHKPESQIFAEHEGQNATCATHKTAPQPGHRVSCCLVPTSGSPALTSSKLGHSDRCCSTLPGPLP